MDPLVTLIGALMLVISIMLSPLSSRLGMPVLLIFLVVGMIMGEDGPGGILFDDFELAFLIANLALGVILLDGGMRTRAETFRVGLRPALVLASVGVFPDRLRGRPGGLVGVRHALADSTADRRHYLLHRRSCGVLAASGARPSFERTGQCNPGNRVRQQRPDGDFPDPDAGHHD